MEEAGLGLGGAGLGQDFRQAVGLKEAGLGLGGAGLGQDFRQAVGLKEAGLELAWRQNR